MIGKINGNYRIIKAVQVDSCLSIVLGEHTADNSYVTWLATDYNGYGNFSFNLGHYIIDRDEALMDFWLRVRKEIDFHIAYLEDRLNRF